MVIKTILLVVIIVLLITLFVSMAYLEFFLIRKLYNEICVEKKKVKIPFWQGYDKRLECLYGFLSLESYRERIIRAKYLHRFSIGVGILLMVFLVIYKMMGYTQSSKTDPKIIEKVTVTKIEDNKTTVRNYESLEDFLK